MSFSIEGHGGYGSGRLGDVTNPSNFINGYAFATDFSGKTFLATPKHESTLAGLQWKDCVGCQIMLHCIASAAYGNLGRYFVTTVTACVAEGSGYRITTADVSHSDIGNTDSWHWQAILIPEFNNLTISSSYIAPFPVTVVGDFAYGGVLAFKCKGSLNLSGGHINLESYGLSPNTANIDKYRPLCPHEQNGTLDTDRDSGCENSITKDRLLVNVGDGACFIMAKTVNQASGSSRIGTSSFFGVQYCRGAEDSTSTPANATNIGGSTILVACDYWTNFTPAVIAKYRKASATAGRGLARAYLAVGSPGNSILDDEGLYAFDCTQNIKRVKEQFNISGFGNGQTGTFTYTSTPGKSFNIFARVTGVSGRVYTCSTNGYTSYSGSLVEFKVGALVMIHQTQRSGGNDYTNGNFKISRITAVSGNTVTIKHNFTWNLSKYHVQMIVIPEFNNFTLSAVHDKVEPWDSSGFGGICAIAVAGTCNLSGGTINTESKGILDYGLKDSDLNKMMNNFFMKRTLPIGQGHGSVFILAKNLTMSTSTRLGGTYDGSAFGGRGGAADKSSFPAGGGYRGKDGTDKTKAATTKTGGWGGGPGLHPEDSDYNGGWFSNSYGLSNKAREGTSRSGLQGAHILIIADTITGFNLSAMSTGGSEGEYNNGALALPGGCGYGGGGAGSQTTVTLRYGAAGGFRGGGGGGPSNPNYEYSGGGGSGSAFVYCNNVVSQNTTGLVTS